MVSSDEINRRLEARRRGIKYQERDERNRTGMESAETKECPSCHSQNPPTAKFCVGCGEKLETPKPASEVEPEKEFSTEIKGPDEPTPEKPIQNKHKITQRPDDFSKPRKLKPIIPSEPTPKPEPETTAEPESEKKPEPTPETGKTTMEQTPSQSGPEKSIIPESKPEPQKPPRVKRPDTIPTPKSKIITTPATKPVAEPETPEPQAKSDVDPVERIKKAKELLDLGAITQEEFDKIKNKYLNDI